MIESIYEPEILNPGDRQDHKRIASLRSDKQVFVVDRMPALLQELFKIRNPRIPHKLHPEKLEVLVEKRLNSAPVEEQGVWVYYPWNQHLVHLLSEAEFIEVRTNRNKYKITGAEQSTLSTKKIGVAGLSVGRSISLTMAMERSFGEIRLADFDTIELSNLNRIQGSLTELGVNKAVAAAREIKELDPFLKVKVFEEGLTDDNLDDFFDTGGKLDLFVEECDGLDIKISSRIEAKKRGIPVFMEASDRCMIDVERFDQEPDRPLLHGLVGDVSIKELKNLKSDEEKLPYLTKIVGVESLSPRMRASMLEIEQTITSWPQLAADVNKGGGIGAEIVRNILLGKSSGSGRFYIDTEALVPLERRELHSRKYSSFKVPEVSSPSEDLMDQLISKSSQSSMELPMRDLRKLLEAANAAPSGGNTQPWIWKEHKGQLFVFHDKSRSYSLLDKSTGASMVAIGCSVQNLCLKAKNLGYTCSVQRSMSEDYPLIACVKLDKDRSPAKGEDVQLERWIFGRSTNRTIAHPDFSASHKLDTLQNQWNSMSRMFDFNIIQDRESIEQITEIVAQVEKERILAPWGYHDYIQEVRWDHEENESKRDGVYIGSVELTKAEATGLRISRDARVMDEFDSEKSGSAFMRLISKSTLSSLGVGIITSTKMGRPEWFMVGQELQRIWLMLNSIGLDLQPISPITFLKDGLSSTYTGNNQASNDLTKSLNTSVDIQMSKLNDVITKSLGIDGTTCFMFRILSSNYDQDISLRRMRNGSLN